MQSAGLSPQRNLARLRERSRSQPRERAGRERGGRVLGHSREPRQPSPGPESPTSPSVPSGGGDSRKPNRSGIMIARRTTTLLASVVPCSEPDPVTVTSVLRHCLARQDGTMFPHSRMRRRAMRNDVACASDQGTSLHAGEQRGGGPDVMVAFLVVNIARRRQAPPWRSRRRSVAWPYRLSVRWPARYDHDTER
jgi:hypothetical protein